MPYFQLLLSLFLFSVLIYGLWRKTAANSAWKYIFWPALSFKLLCGVLLGQLYAGYGDSFMYFNKALILTEVGLHNVTQFARIIFFNEVDETILSQLDGLKIYSNSFFFIKLISLLNFITGSNYYFNGLFLSLFSFSGCWYFTRTLEQIFPGTKKAAVIACLLFPSVIFWNSGLMKEPVLMGLLCFFWGLVLKIVYETEGKLFFKVLVLLLVSWLFWKIKFFIAFIVFGLTIGWIVFAYARKRFAIMQNILFVRLFLPLFILSMVVSFSLLLQNIASGFFYRHIVWNYETLLARSAGKPVILLHDLKPTPGSILMNIPEALYSAILRPFIWEGNTVFFLLAGVENLVILLLILGSLLPVNTVKLSRIPGFFWMLLAFILITASLIGLTTPNFGTLNRYRTVFLPFLVFLLLQMPFWQKIMDRFFQKINGKEV